MKKYERQRRSTRIQKKGAKSKESGLHILYEASKDLAKSKKHKPMSKKKLVDDDEAHVRCKGEDEPNDLSGDENGNDFSIQLDDTIAMIQKRQRPLNMLEPRTKERQLEKKPITTSKEDDLERSVSGRHHRRLNARGTIVKERSIEKKPLTTPLVDDLERHDSIRHPSGVLYGAMRDRAKSKKHISKSNKKLVNDQEAYVPYKGEDEHTDTSGDENGDFSKLDDTVTMIQKRPHRLNMYDLIAKERHCEKQPITTPMQDDLEKSMSGRRRRPLNMCDTIAKERSSQKRPLTTTLEDDLERHDLISHPSRVLYEATQDRAKSKKHKSQSNTKLVDDEEGYVPYKGEDDDDYSSEDGDFSKLDDTITMIQKRQHLLNMYDLIAKERQLEKQSITTPVLDDLERSMAGRRHRPLNMCGSTAKERSIGKRPLSTTLEDDLERHDLVAHPSGLLYEAMRDRAKSKKHKSQGNSKLVVDEEAYVPYKGEDEDDYSSGDEDGDFSKQLNDTTTMKQKRQHLLNMYDLIAKERQLEKQPITNLVQDELERSMAGRRHRRLNVCGTIAKERSIEKPPLITPREDDLGRHASISHPRGVLYGAMQDRARSKKRKSMSDKTLVDDDEAFVPYKGEDEHNDSSGDDNGDFSKQLDDAITRIQKRQHRLNMYDLIAKERQLEKQPITTPVQDNLERRRRHILDMRGIHTTLVSRAAQPQSETSHPKSRVHVSSFNSPTSPQTRSVEPINDLRVKVNLSYDDSDLDVDELTGTVSTPTNKKNVRRAAKPWIEWNNRKKKMLEWNELCQPVCRLECKLMSQLGYYVRCGNLFPLTLLSWRDVNKDTLEAIWDEVKDNTNAPDGFKPICFSRMAAAWKQWKYRLKADFYEKFQTDEERLKNRPPHINKDQWRTLVSYWGLKKTNKIANQNSENRKRNHGYSRTGRKPHAIVAKERIEAGEPVDNISLWLATRAPKNKPINVEDGSSDRAAMLERRLNELPEEKRNDPEERNEIFKEVVGEVGHGYALLKGVGIRPPSTPKTSLLLLKDVNQLKKDAEDREARHRQEVEDRDNRHKQELIEIENRHQQALLEMKTDMISEMQKLFKGIVPHRASITSPTSTN